MINEGSRANIEGIRWAIDPANKEEVVKLLADRLKLAPDIADASYKMGLDEKAETNITTLSLVKHREQGKGWRISALIVKNESLVTQ